MCSMHEARLRRTRSTSAGPTAPAPLAERLRRHVTERGPSACWSWNGATNSRGYGILRVAGRNRYAHRIAWELAHGTIPDGLFVMHACDNPPCTNPAHLQVGTHAANMKDAELKGRLRLRRGTPSGEANPAAKLTDADVVAIRALSAQGCRNTDIATRFGVDKSTVGLILKGVTWRGVA